MTDTTEAIAHVRRLCEMPYPDTYSGHYGFGTMHTILAHIDAQAAEITALRERVLDQEEKYGDALWEIGRLRGLLCKCDMRTKLVGDGCEFCNPELADELKEQTE